MVSSGDDPAAGGLGDDSSSTPSSQEVSRASGAGGSSGTSTRARQWGQRPRVPAHLSLTRNERSQLGQVTGIDIVRRTRVLLEREEKPNRSAA